jgi:hemolysin activation/secretion protein
MMERLPLFYFGLVFSLLTGVIARPVYAQNVPTSIDAGRIGVDIQTKTIEPAQISAAKNLVSQEKTTAPQGAETITFKLNKVIFINAKIIPEQDLQNLYRDLVGKTITLAQLYSLADSVTQYYRNAGFFLARAIIPEQEIDQGIVRIKVVEGFIDRIHLKSQTDKLPKSLEKQILRFGQKIKGQGSALNAKLLERYLLLMNDLPGTSVRAILSPSPTTVGAADLTLVVKQKKAGMNLGLDNFGNSYLGPVRLISAAQINSLFGSSDQTSGTFLWAPNNNELHYFNLETKKNIFNEGTKIALRGNFTTTDPTLPDDLGGALEPVGQSYTLRAYIEHPFIRQRRTNLSGQLGFDFNQNKTDYATGLSAIETIDDQRIVNVSLSGYTLDSWAGYNSFDLSYNKGLEIFGSSKQGDSNLSRSAGSPDFHKLNAEISRLQRISRRVTGLIGVTGQVSSHALLASEELGIGGTDYGRGYDSSEITGDRGFAAKTEVAYEGKPLFPGINDYQLYGFYDAGAVWNRDDGSKRASLASTGVGVRFGLGKSVRGDTYIAKPLTRPVSSRQESKNKDLRFKFSLSTSF